MIALEQCFALARLSLRLGTIDRATMHEDGERYESDTTHTCMLGLLALALAPQSAVRLDGDRVASFALVHDLAEAYAGDTNTARGLTDEQAADKAARERAAMQRIGEELEGSSAYIFVYGLLEEYEEQEAPEARFIRYLDKILPKLTHRLNRGAALSKLGMGFSDAIASHRQQGADLRAQYPEFTNLHDLFEAASIAAEAVLP